MLCTEEFNGITCSEPATKIVWWTDPQTGEIRERVLCEDDANDYCTWRAGELEVKCDDLKVKVPTESRVPLRYYELDEEPELV